MPNVFDYLEWRGDLSFKTSPFNAVDNIIFSIMSYFVMDGVVPETFDPQQIGLPTAIKKMLQQIKKHPAVRRNYLFGDDQINLLYALEKAERYHDIYLSSYVNKFDVKKQMQFSALTFTATDCPPYIAYRGTDTTIVGWKEDFNMICDKAVPAQLEAVDYLEKKAQALKGDFNIGGHSKGGNLAVYAAAFCNKKLQNRINAIYNNDAPGFFKETTERKEYKQIEPKICTYIPQDSVVGLLFEHQKNYSVVKSTETGIMQHNPFSWQVTKNNLAIQKSVTENSLFLNETLMKWLDSMDKDTRRHFINTLFDVLNKTNVNSIPDFTDNWLKNTAVLIKSMSELDKETKIMLNKTFSMLFDIAIENFKSAVANKITSEGKNFTARIRKV
ncbi:MAG: DUF2974 domain-containing protein [Termitinemataceae bacterium]|nr:MAG: DUF2974 domain-containing protein [Termitinemataceae bacterium]